MGRSTRTLALAALMAIVAGPGTAGAQPLGTYTWQLQPFCNRVTVHVTQANSLYTLDGFDDQCGAGQRAPLVGLATPNPDGTIGLGFTIVTVPGGRPVHVETRITLAGLGGPWTDNAGNAGTFAFNAQAAGSARPAPTIPASALTPGSVTTTVLAAGAVTAAAIADGTIGSLDINQAQVQRRVVGPCPRGEFMTDVAITGPATCNDGATGGAGSVALGGQTLASNPSANQSTAIGSFALQSNAVGASNTAVGAEALRVSLTSNNTAVGTFALNNATSGGPNTALGFAAGTAVTTGSNNIHIANGGVAGDNNVIRIGGSQAAAFMAGINGVNIGTGSTVLVSSTGQLGTVTSSRRFKQDIADMGDASSAVLRLRPVTFRYTAPAADGTRPLDYGLIAEEVAEVFPDLAVRGADGQIETVAYHKLPALLLNELQKLQKLVEAQGEELRALRTLATSATPK